MALLRNNALRQHPSLRRMPTSERGWEDFLKALDQESAVGALSESVLINLADITWGGFSVDPSAPNIKFVNADNSIFIWNSAGSDKTGTSNGSTFTLTIADTRVYGNNSRKFLCPAINNGTEVLALVEVTKGAGVAVFTFSIAEVSGSNIIFNSTGWTASGNKGYPAGWCGSYALT